MNTDKFSKDSFKNPSLAEAIEALLLVDYKTTSESNGIASALLVLANSFPSDKPNIAPILEVTQQVTNIKKSKVVFKDSSLATKKKSGDCDGCDKTSATIKIRTVEDVLKLGDKAYLLKVAKEMGLKLSPGAKPEAIAKAILKLEAPKEELPKEELPKEEPIGE